MEPLPIDTPGQVDDLSAVGVLARVRAGRDAEEGAARATLLAMVDWAAIHSADTIAGGVVGPMDDWHEQLLPLGGEGAPVVAEFAVVELAAALGMSTQAGRARLSDAVELRYRLPQTFARVVAGDLEVWRARRIAQATHALSPDAATWVDREVAPVADSIGAGRLTRLVEQALVMFDPDAAEERRLAQLPSAHVDICLDGGREGLGIDSLVHLDALLDLADATVLEEAVAAGAEQLRAAGSPATLDQRRAHALAVLARGDVALPTPTSPTPTAPTSRMVVVHAHVHTDATGRLDQAGWGEVDTGHGPAVLAAVDTITGWCQAVGTRVVVKPVIDTTTELTAAGYRVPDRIREQVVARDGVCAFPHCTRSARHADLDHITPYDPDGPPDQTRSSNLAPVCRTHHRAKTTGGWSYEMLPGPPGRYRWRSPLGQRFVTERHQTWRLPDDYSSKPINQVIPN